ncbi:NAD(P)/FAD-dependent oxidoreductase [Paraburkholderia saeva]|uniref:NAD(P)/FAD-dependent oxidoreductase n=1 Tax=Paraburkholderia saeva TaxID=2777537 RepID=UPI001E1557EB|nr:FAD-dependent oxidoreductase [Paraburkholderia saeva]CAG4886006.1 Anthranilate 1,2-dioxygenase system ferredoxin--NAD(+) reductase component [Paraburkholderia saeva]CAG4901378.1 Anthranilate 1,2-dioxygenase system ferredoxin--NAD(+) reductase component [Paraburkholderia saeva]
MKTAEHAAMVIVGAGQCGARTAHALRENGWEGEITLLGNEGLAPYDRPPLSKAVLLGQKTTAQCALFNDAFYRDNRIDLRVDAPVSSIDRAERKVVLGDGRSVSYHRLLIATGAEPRRLAVPGATLAGVHLLRAVPDALSIIDELTPGRRIAIVGAGFIGLEIAATAITRGCEVVVIEAAARALMRAVPEVVAGYLVERHRQMGVDVRFATQVERILGESRVTGLKLSDGATLECDAVIVGVGVSPRTALAEAAGIDVADGIAVDDTLRTNDPYVFAAGDVCSFPHRLFRRRIRLECWKNAEDHARVVARNMLDYGETYSAVPWFWSNQYDMTIQIAGMPAFGTTSVVREVGSASRLFFALDGEGVLVGASGVGQVSEVARDVRVAQELIARRARIDPAVLKDPSAKLKSLLTAEAL